MSTAWKMLIWEKLFFPLQQKPFLITQCNCTSIGSCCTKKKKQMARHMQPAIARQNRRSIWLYKRPLRCHISDFFEGSDWGVQLIARPGTQYLFHISSNRDYDSNRVCFLSIIHSYCVKDACMGTSIITLCYDVERLKTKTQANQ